MLIAGVLLVLARADLPQPTDAFWAKRAHTLNVVMVSGVTNGYQTLYWAYTIKEPLPTVLGRFAKSYDFHNNVVEWDDERLLRRGAAWGIRRLNGRSQSVALRKGRYVVKDGREQPTYDEAYTTLSVNESVLMGNKPPKGWPSAMHIKFARPKLTDVGIPSLQKVPYQWHTAMSASGTVTYWFTYRDERDAEAVLDEFDKALVGALKWKRREGPPDTNFLTLKGVQPRTGINKISVTAPGSLGGLWDDACTVTVSFTDVLGSVEWKHPATKRLYRSYPKG